MTDVTEFRHIIVYFQYFLGVFPLSEYPLGVGSRHLHGLSGFRYVTNGVAKPTFG
jgi:hypothetical protein